MLKAKDGTESRPSRVGTEPPNNIVTGAVGNLNPDMKQSNLTRFVKSAKGIPK